MMKLGEMYKKLEDLGVTPETSIKFINGQVDSDTLAGWGLYYDEDHNVVVFYPVSKQEDRSNGVH